MHLLATIVIISKVLMVATWMESVLHMDPHEHTSGRLLVVYSMEPVVINGQSSIVLVTQVTLMTPLHLWEMTTSVTVLQQKQKPMVMLTQALIDYFKTMLYGIIKIISMHAMDSIIHRGSTRLFLSLPQLILKFDCALIMALTLHI